jgi:hypothetical protein
MAKEDWKAEWCDKIYCLVPKDCEVGDVELQYDGNFGTGAADEDDAAHKMDGYWSSKNCDASLWPTGATTSSPVAATTASP